MTRKLTYRDIQDGSNLPIFTTPEFDFVQQYQER